MSKILWLNPEMRVQAAVTTCLEKEKNRNINLENRCSTDPNYSISTSYPASGHPLGFPCSPLCPTPHLHLLESLLEGQGAAPFVQHPGDASSAEDSRRSAGAQGQRNLLVTRLGRNQPFGNGLDHISTNQLVRGHSWRV